MALTFTALLNGSTTTNGTSFTTGGTATVAASDILVVLAAAAEGSGGADSPTSVACDGNELTKLTGRTFNGANFEVSLWYITGVTITSKAVVVTYAGTQTSFIVLALKIAGADTTTPFGTAVATSGSAASGSVTIATPANTSGTMGLAAVSNNTAMTAGTGFTRTNSSTVTANAMAAMIETRTDAVATVDGSWANGNFGLIGVEVKASSVVVAANTHNRNYRRRRAKQR